MFIPALIILLFLTVAILSLVVLISFREHEKSNQLVSHLVSQNDILRRSSQEQTQKALEKVHQETQRLIQVATDKAASIMEDATAFHKMNDKDLQESIKQLSLVHQEAFTDISKNMEKEYQAQLRDGQDKVVEMFHTITKDIERTASDQITDFRSVLEKETVESQKIVEQKLDTQYQAVEKELDVYKKAQMKQIEEEAKQKLHDMVFTSLEKSLTHEQKEALLKDALANLAGRT